MAEIMHLLKIDAPRESVYRAIASVEGVRNWLSRDADFDSMMGNSGEIRFAGGTRILKILLEELKPTTRVAWNVLSGLCRTGRAPQSSSRWTRTGATRCCISSIRDSSRPTISLRCQPPSRSEEHTSELQ